MDDTSVDETERSFWYDDPQARAKSSRLEARCGDLQDENGRLRKALEEIRGMAAQIGNSKISNRCKAALRRGANDPKTN